MIIQFHPVIEDGEEAVRVPQKGEWYMQDCEFCIARFYFALSSPYPIYHRVDLEIDPIKEVWDKGVKANALTGLYRAPDITQAAAATLSDMVTVEEVDYFTAIDDYIKKVYGEEK